MSECCGCQDQRTSEQMPLHVDGYCIWCQYLSYKERTKDLAQAGDKKNARIDQYKKDIEGLKQRAEKAEAELKIVNSVRTFALCNFGRETVTRRTNGSIEFIKFKDVDKEMMKGLS